MLRVVLVLLAVGVVLAVLTFLSGLGRGLSGAGTPARPRGGPVVRARRASTVRGLLLLMIVGLFGGVMLGRPLLLVLALICLAAAYFLRGR